MQVDQTLIRIMVVDDHTIVREGLVALLDSVDDMQVIASVADGLTALESIVKFKPDVVVCDLGLPGLSGLKVIERCTQNKNVHARFLALSMYHDKVWIQRSIHAGAQGYLVKGVGIKDLQSAIRSIHKGHTFFPTLQEKEQQTFVHDSEDILSKREQEVLTLLAQGHTSREMSEILHISKRTVEHHRAHIMDKTKVYDVAGLTRYAIRHGYVDVHLK